MRVTLAALFILTLIGVAMAKEKSKWVVQSIPHAVEEKKAFDSVPLSDKPSPVDMSRKITGKAFRFLSAAQNSNGSFGKDGEQYKATALVLIAFTRHMQSAGSDSKYGEVIAKATQWLRASSPKTDEDKIAATVALAGIYTSMARNPKTQEHKESPDDKRKMTSMLKEIKGSKDNPWFDFLAMTELPLDVGRPAWSVNTDALNKKYKGKDSTFAFSATDDCLTMYLVTVAKWRDEKARPAHMKQIATALKAKQDKQGAILTSDPDDTPAVTALSAMCFSLDYVTAHRFFSTPASTEKK